MKAVNMKNKYPILFTIIFCVMFCFLFSLIPAAFAAVTPANTIPASNASSGSFKYILLESLPGFFQAGNEMTDFPGLILAIYKFGIWTIGISGLFMLTIGGIMYIGSAGNTSTAGTAKGIITDALIGVFAAMAAYLILYVINPDLIKLNINFMPVNVDIVTESSDMSAESSGNLSGAGGAGGSGGATSAGTPGSCGGLATQSGIASQCSSAAPQLATMLTCIAGQLPTATVTSITDSKGYANCTPDKWSKPPCAHAEYSCHYGGKTCYSTGKSYAADISTRGMSSSTIMSAAKTCGASYVLDESVSANHVHVSVGKAAGCGCN